MSPIKPLIPSSKSYTQRALILAALAEGKSTIQNPLECDDSYHLRNALRELSATIDDTNPNLWTVQGLDRHIIRKQCSGSKKGSSSTSKEGVQSSKDGSQSSREAVHCWSENAGTVLRFVSSLSVILNKSLIIDGNRRLRKRPLKKLVKTLSSAGIFSKFIATKGSLPLLLEKSKGRKAKRSQKGRKKDEIWIDPSMTSQLLSGLLMACPLLEKPVTIKLAGKPVSGPYVDMTLKAMADFGYKDIRYIDELTILVKPGSYKGAHYLVEKDWSSAATMLTAAWLTCSAIDAKGLNTRSLQGDKTIAGFLEQLSEETSPSASTDDANSFDITNCPDIIGPLTIASLFATRPTIISGVNHTKIKECDRPATLSRELKKVGAEVFDEDNVLKIIPLSQDRLLSALSLKEQVITENIVLDPEDDHRMAMAFGLLSLKIPYIKIKNRECVSKSFSGFWENLELFREQ